MYASVPYDILDETTAFSVRIRMETNEIDETCTSLSQRVLDLEKIKTTQAADITELKERVKKLEKKGGSRTHKFNRLYKVGLSAQVISSNDEASLGNQDDASKQGMKILDIDADEDITLDSTHVDTDSTLVDTDPDMFGVHDLYSDEVFVEIEEHVVNAATTTITTVADEVVMNLDQTLIEIKSAKPKLRVKVALNLQAELEEEERISRQKEEEANIALIESWDNTQAMMDAYYQMA
ncbi:hypothetical protein Tco_0535518 [Tanacetum coccineum]